MVPGVVVEFLPLRTGRFVFSFVSGTRDEMMSTGATAAVVAHGGCSDIRLDNWRLLRCEQRLLGHAEMVPCFFGNSRKRQTIRCCCVTGKSTVTTDSPRAYETCLEAKHGYLYMCVVACTFGRISAKTGCRLALESTDRLTGPNGPSSRQKRRKARFTDSKFRFCFEVRVRGLCVCVCGLFVPPTPKKGSEGKENVLCLA